MSIGEMVRLIEKNINIPDTDAGAFVLNYESSEMDANKDERFLRFIMTSKLLLKNATKGHILHVDATYKLLWHGLPTMVLGTTDHNNFFHLIAVGVSTNEKQADFEFMFSSLKSGVERFSNEEFQPTVRCGGRYAHVIANMKKQKRLDDSRENWLQMKIDMTYIQLVSLKAAFLKAQKYFIKKWRTKTEAAFCEYVQRIWFDRNSNWYEGVRHFTPSTNNALEAFNSVIKRDYTFRKKIGIW